MYWGTQMPLSWRFDQAFFDKIITEPEDINFENLPAPDRVWTNSRDKRYQNNGNFKYHPGTYIQVADGCWHGKCTFCVEKKNTWKVRPVWDVMNELEEIDMLGFKEVFDDSGTFPVGEWLTDFLKAVSRRNFNFRLGCNMRLVNVDYSAMRSAGFRLLLYGIESANASTLKRIHKGTTPEDIKYLYKANEAGLECHVAFMIFPWETHEETMNTINLVKRLLIKGIAKTAQCSVYDVGEKKVESNKYLNKIYDVKWSPEFWINKFKDLKTASDIKYLIRQIREGLFHG